jgi:hypothetical protein
MTPSVLHFTRKQLYEIVWAEPIRGLAQRFGISDVGLAKACRKAGIPLPPRGFWAKHKAERSPPQPPLPPRSPGMRDEVTVGKGQDRYWQSHLSEAEILGPLPSPPEFDEPISEIRDRVKVQIGKLRVSNSFVKVHPVISQLLTEDELRREKQRNSPYPVYSNAPLFDTPLERRRLRILSALFFGIGRAGGKSLIRGREAKEVEVKIGEQYMNLAFERMHDKRKAPSDGHIQQKALRFEIKAFGVESEGNLFWQDDETGSLERKILDIAIEIVVAGEIQYRASCQRQYQWRVQRRTHLKEEIRQRKEEAVRQALKRKAENEKRQIDELLTAASALRQANEIRNYVSVVRATSVTSDSVELRAEIDAWTDWALAQADRIDPIVSGSFRKQYSDRQ